MGTSSQRGYVTPRGKKWYGYFRKNVNDPTTAEQKTVRVAVILGPRSQTKRSEAREALEREISKQNRQTGDAGKVMNAGSVSFGWFVRNRFLPLKEANWKEETGKVKKTAYPKGPYPSIRQDSAGEFRQVHPAGPPEQFGANEIQGQSASDEGILATSLLRPSIRTSSRRIRLARLEFHNYARPTKQR